MGSSIYLTGDAFSCMPSVTINKMVLNLGLSCVPRREQAPFFNFEMSFPFETSVFPVSDTFCSSGKWLHLA